MLGGRFARLTPLSADEVLAQLKELAPEALFVTMLGERPVTCPDLRDIGRCCQAVGQLCVVDVTHTGPWGCAAISLGAQVAIAALDGVGTLVAGARELVSDEQDDAPSSGRGQRQGGVPSTERDRRHRKGRRCAQSTSSRAEDSALYSHVGSWMSQLPELSEVDTGELAETLRLRERDWRLASDAAQVVAAYLRCHPHVAEVRYPGLTGDASFAVAARTLHGGFGPVVDWREHAEQHRWHRITCDPRDAREQVLSLERSLG